MAADTSSAFHVAHMAPRWAGVGSPSSSHASQMASLYVDAEGFTSAVSEAAAAAVAAGFLLGVDADAIVTWAPLQWAAQVSD